MRWRCQIRDTNGEQCPNAATTRIHFNVDNPFNHVDVCEDHINEYKVFAWKQFHLDEYGE